MIILRDYQRDLISKAKRSMASGNKSVLIQAATGAGKTALASSMVKGAYDKGNVAFFTVHRKDLIKQTAGAFDEFGIPYSYIASGYPLNPYAKVFICSIDTLKNRLDGDVVPNVVFVDECHMANSAGWSKVISNYKSKGAYIVGLSATPWRLDGSGLGDNFADMVCGPSMEWLIAHGYLSQYRYFAPSTIDTTGIGMVAGDYNKGQLAERMEQDAVIVGDAIKYYKSHASGMRAVCYCVSRKHSLATVDKFKDAGINAAHIDGETPMAERARLIGLFADGIIQVLCNVELITTGFDLAAQVGRDVTIDCVILLRPTQSLSLYLQMVGRGLRPKDYPAIILDHAGNAHRHGLPAEPREWSLSARAKKGRGNSEPSIPTRQCTSCFYVHSPRPECPHCGFVYPIKFREVDEVDGELQELSAGLLLQGKIETTEVESRQLQHLIAHGRKKGYKNPEFWAAKVITANIAKKRGLRASST